MLGDVVELSVVVRDLDEAVERFGKLFKLKVHHRGESKEFGFKNAILPTGIGHIELLQPTDPDKAVGKFLARHGEGVYLVGFEVKDIPGAVTHLKAQGVKVDDRRSDVVWVHPRETHGLFVEMRHREKYD
ncbi:MAG TPA: VOC family protein [Candidatus Binatia bacterium]|jgi:methylmalonyl-CoA/ethylmalonyl-CoA epimerase|nr:VOC family protein [Candidatus Binatia bacterium]